MCLYLVYGSLTVNENNCDYPFYFFFSLYGEELNLAKENKSGVGK